MTSYGFAAQFGIAPAAEGKWIKDDLIDRALLAPLDDAGVLAKCTHVSIDLANPKKITSRKKLAEDSRAWRYDLVTLTSGTDDSPDWEVVLRLQADELQVGVSMRGKALESVRSKLLAMTRGCVTAWSEALPKTISLITGSLTPNDDDYPRPRPPRRSPLWAFGLLQQYFGVRWHEADPERAAFLGEILKAKLPAGATRRTEKDVVSISFIDDLADPEAIARVRAAHEAWLAPLVETEVERGWNEQGDRMVIPHRAEPRDPLTLYEKDSAIGYKAIVVQKNGDVDDEIWEELIELLGAGKLPDRAPLKAVRLIVPRRQDALKVHERAIEAGFEKVLYPKGKVFWEVHPT